MPVGVAKQALYDSPFCGDACGSWPSNGHIVLCMADGLGHGQEAERAAKAALEYVGSHLSDPLTILFSGCDEALRKTRGVAMAVAIVDEASGALRYAGIGNTMALLHRRSPRRLCGLPGIVGGGYRHLGLEEDVLGRDDLLVLYTDGLRSEIDLTTLPTRLLPGVDMLAAKILQDWSRGTDDAGVLVYRRS